MLIHGLQQWLVRFEYSLYEHRYNSTGLISDDLFCSQEQIPMLPLHNVYMTRDLAIHNIFFNFCLNQFWLQNSLGNTKGILSFFLSGVTWMAKLTQKENTIKPPFFSFWKVLCIMLSHKMFLEHRFLVQFVYSYFWLLSSSPIQKFSC